MLSTLISFPSIHDINTGQKMVEDQVLGFYSIYFEWDKFNSLKNDILLPNKATKSLELRRKKNCRK